MDLIERGRSLSELGRTLTWSDIRALLLHLPADATVRRVAPPTTTDTPPSTPHAQPARRAAPVRRRASAAEIRQRVKALET